MILMWDKPKKKMSAAEHAEYGFEDGPTGGYMPNMSDDDVRRWKAKETGQKLGFPQVELRKGFGQSLCLIIVNLGMGYHYKKSYTPHHGQFYNPTEGFNIHMSSNGALQMSFEEMAEMHQAVEEAKQYLLSKYGPLPEDMRLVCSDFRIGDKVKCQHVVYNNMNRTTTERVGTVVGLYDSEKNIIETTNGTVFDGEKSYVSESMYAVMEDGTGYEFITYGMTLTEPVEGVMPPDLKPSAKTK